MTVALGALPSTSPLPTGRVLSKAISAGGQVAFPSSGNWFYAGPGLADPMQLGPFNLPYRYLLFAAVNMIVYVNAAWTRYDQQIQLANASGEVADLNGISYFQKADSSEAHGGSWVGASIEARFYCEANLPYYVRLLSLSSPANTYYYQHPVHLNMFAYTVGEGVY
jgi:hypothetical protein